MQYLLSQGEKLSVQPKLKGNILKVRGSCSQVYKFRQYLVNLLTEKRLTLPSHHAQPNQAIHTHDTASPVPEQVPDEGGSNEAAATGSGSAGDGRTFTGLSKDVLLLMPKVREGCSKNMKFFPEEGKVIVLASSEEEQEQCITQFQNTYQEIIKNRQLKSGSLEIPPSFQMENMFDLLEEFGGKYNQCHFSCDEKARVIKIISMSSRQFDQAKKLITDRLAGEKWEEKKEEKGGGGGGGGKPGKGAMRFKISTKPGSSEVLSINKDRKLIVKRGNLVEEDVEIIVNAANSQLKHAGGVALALNKASHGELQKLSNNYTRSYGDIPVGGTALTRSGGGKLKCKWVIHAVGPIANETKSEETCSELIFKAISNSLIEAQKKNAKSISFPALSTGIYAVKKSLAADAIFQAILKFHYTSSKILKDIRIIILDEDTYSVFAQHLLAVKAAGTEALNGKEEETSFQTAADHVVSTTTHQGYDSSTYQGYGQPTHTSYSSAVGGGHSSATGGGYSSSAGGGHSSSAGGSHSSSAGGGYSSAVGGGYSNAVGGGYSSSAGGGHSSSAGGSHSSSAGGGYSSAVGGGHPPTAGRGISSTGTPPGFHHSPITTQPTGHLVIPPHTSVVTSSSFLTTTTATGRGIMLKPALLNYGGGRGGGSIGAGGGGIGRGALTTGGIGTGGIGTGGIGTGGIGTGVIGTGALTTGGIGTGAGSNGAGSIGTGADGNGAGSTGTAGAGGNGVGVGAGGTTRGIAETGGIQGGGFGSGGSFGEGVGRGQEGWQQQQQVPGGAVTNKLLTPADLAQIPPPGITRSSSHDDQYSTPPDSLTHSHNKGGEGATPTSNKTDDDKGIMTV